VRFLKGATDCVQARVRGECRPRLGLGECRKHDGLAAAARADHHRRVARVHGVIKLYHLYTDQSDHRELLEFGKGSLVETIPQTPDMGRLCASTARGVNLERLDVMTCSL